MALETNWLRAKRQPFSLVCHLRTATFGLYSSVLNVSNLREPEAQTTKACEQSDCCFCGKLEDDNKGATLEFLFPLYAALLTRWHWKTVSRVQCNKPVRLLLRKNMYTWKTVWGRGSWVKSVFWEIRGKVSLSQRLPLFCLLERPCLWLEDKACWVLCLYWWKNSHPQTDPHSTLGVDSISEKCLPIENALTVLQGAKQLHSTRCLLYV